MEDLSTMAAQRLTAAGGRMTGQRRLILETLTTLRGHPSAVQIYSAARQRDPALNPSTVYRTLDWLERAGLVTPRRLGAGPGGSREQRFDRAGSVEHHHFVCTGCDRVIEFSTRCVEQAAAELARSEGLRVEHASLILHGLCRSCQATGAAHDAAQMTAAAEARLGPTSAGTRGAEIDNSGSY